MQAANDMVHTSVIDQMKNNFVQKVASLQRQLNEQAADNSKGGGKARGGKNGGGNNAKRKGQGGNNKRNGGDNNGWGKGPHPGSQGWDDVDTGAAPSRKISAGAMAFANRRKK